MLVELDAYLYKSYPVDEFPPEINHILEAGTYGEIKRMFVKPEARGHRIAEKILYELDTVARSEGIERLVLETGVRQPKAIRLYERCGYTVRGSFGGYSDDFVSVFMEKRLAEKAL